MNGSIPWILVAVLGGLILVGGFGVFVRKTRQESGGSIFTTIHKKTFLTLLTVGLICALGGAFLMFNGEILGDNTTGIAEVVGIVGICLIATASTIGIAVQKKMSAK